MEGQAKEHVNNLDSMLWSPPMSFPMSARLDQVKNSQGQQLQGEYPSEVSAFSSQSPKTGHNKAGQSDFQNQRFEPDTGNIRKMLKVPPTQKIRA